MVATPIEIDNNENE